MFEITSPEPYTGFIGPVQFVQGKATTDHPSVVAYCRRHGYTVEPVEQAAPEAPEEDDGQGGGEQPPARPAKSASKADWLAYAVAQGMLEEEAEAATRDQLVERYAPADGGDA